MSAANQEQRLLSGGMKADAFDFGYLRFSLGAPGARALDRLGKIQNHPDAAVIRDGAARAKAAKDAWDYAHPGAAPTPAPPDDGATQPEDSPQPGPMDLPLNPSQSEKDAGTTASKPN